MINDAADRCAGCRQAPRWCICAGQRAVDCPLAVDVLIHASEYWRPTSTGRLLSRVVAGARSHRYERDSPPARAEVARAGHELWILHPRGEDVPAGPRPAALQVLLLDGNWREAAGMARAVAGWGRLVRLPEAGRSRYALRDTPHEGTYATAEALGVLLSALGEHEVAAVPRQQFDLHVYAGLRTRGAKARAEAFLAGSTLREDFPALLAELHRRRRREEGTT